MSNFVVKVCCVVLLFGEYVFTDSHAAGTSTSVPWTLTPPTTTGPLTPPPTTTEVTPPNVIEDYLQTFGIDNYSVPMTVMFGRSASLTKIKYGVYLANATWFEANATCEAQGYERLLHEHDPRRMFWTVKKLLRDISSSFMDLRFWSGYIRPDICNSTWATSSCGTCTEFDRNVEFSNVSVPGKQCTTYGYETIHSIDEYGAVFCDERHPFICEKQLGNVTFNSINVSAIPILPDYNAVHLADVEVGFRADTDACTHWCLSRMRCTAVAYQHDTGQCWLQLDGHTGRLYDIVLVNLSVTTFMKDGYQVEINTNVTTEEAPEVFNCPSGRANNFTTQNTTVCPSSYAYTTATGAIFVTQAQILTPPPNVTATFSASPTQQTAASGTNSLSTWSTTTPLTEPTVPPVSTLSTALSTHSNSVRTVSSPTVASTSNRPTTDAQNNQTEDPVSSPDQSSTRKLCNCPCSSFVAIKQLTQKSTPQEILNRIRKSEIPKQKTGAFRRKLTSAEDGRPASTQLGCVGIAILVCVFGSLVAFDALRILKLK